MSLAGYRDLPTLKARLLPGDMGEGWEHDDDLREIGLGVAAAFDRYTGRILRRTVGAVHECSADQASVIVNCYPIETVDSIEIITGLTAAPAGEIVTGILRKAGIVHFGGRIGSPEQTLRFTLTGGYWCEDKEGDDTTPPDGAAELPHDLLAAWYHQVRSVCEAENIFRTKGAGRGGDAKGSASYDLTNLTLAPAVSRTLQLYMRIP